MITPTQRENLQRLADFLPQVSDRQFSMGCYRATSDLETEIEPRDVVTHECGSVGCAIGWGPVAGVAPLPGEDWDTYGNRAFGADNMDVWSGLFSPGWAVVDNTPEGAAERIVRFLEKDALGNPYSRDD